MPHADRNSLTRDYSACTAEYTFTRNISLLAQVCKGSLEKDNPTTICQIITC